MSVLDLLRDPYEQRARATPGLLVALPLLVPLVCTYGAKQPSLTAVVALLGGCGALYALASIVRGRGKALEIRLIKKWGGLPTTIALRHSDNHFDRVTKARYHAVITERFNIAVPTHDQERADAGSADDCYRAATLQLRERNRDDKNLLLKENISYGFHRNMLAMKTIGLLTSTIGLVCGLLISKVVLTARPYVSIDAILHPGLAGGLTLLVSIPLILAWLFYFNEKAVKQVGFAYAERLFETLGKP